MWVEERHVRETDKVPPETGDEGVHHLCLPRKVIRLESVTIIEVAIRVTQRKLSQNALHIHRDTSLPQENWPFSN